MSPETGEREDQHRHVYPLRAARSRDVYELDSMRAHSAQSAIANGSDSAGSQAFRRGERKAPENPTLPFGKSFAVPGAWT